MSTSPQPIRASLRVSDADRDLVSQVLNTAFAEGRITSDELDERLTAAIGAKTFGDLEPLTSDLMPRTAQTEQYRTKTVVQPASDEHSAIVDTSRQREDADRIMRFLGDHKRTGAWRLAPHTNVICVLGDVQLDLRDAVMEAHRCEISVNVALGSFKLIVPDGVIVTNKTITMLGDDKVRGMRPIGAGAPEIVITGFVALGDVTIQGPDHVSWGKKLGLTS